MVKPLVALSHDARGKSFLPGQSVNCSDKFRIIVLLKAHLGGPELSEVPPGARAGRNVEIVRVHDTVRARDDDRIRFKRRDLFRDLLISPDRLTDLCLTTTPHSRYDHGRMRHHKSSENRHWSPSYSNFIIWYNIQSKANTAPRIRHTLFTKAGSNRFMIFTSIGITT